MNSKSDLTRQKLPFTEKSKWEPNEKLIPQPIRDELSALKTSVGDLKFVGEKSNLSRSQLGALNHLKNKRHLVIKPADKGGQPVLMNRTDYVFEGERQLKDKNYYVELGSPIYPETSAKILDILNDLGKEGFLSQKQINYLKPPDIARPRQFYLLPKIHKPVEKWTVPGKIPPGRPIVSDCSSISYRAAEFIDFHLKPVANKHASFIKDTYDFLDKIREVTIPEGAFLATLDIDSLYTNIETPEGLKAVKEMFEKYPNLWRPDTKIIELLGLCLETNDFLFNDKWYLQVRGCAMGQKYGPQYANIFVASLEERVLAKATKKPLVYLRFLDDIFVIWDHSKEDFLDFVKLLNNECATINFKHEINENSVDFLDVTVYKGPRFAKEGILDTKVFFKPTDTHELLHKSSFHPKHTFEGILKSQLIRYFRISSSRENFNETCSTLFQVLRKKRGYSKRFLRSAKSSVVGIMEKNNKELVPKGASMRCQIRGCNCCLYIKETSEFISNHNDNVYDIQGKITCNSKNVLYLIECKRCGDQYIGETGQKLNVRLAHHVSDIRLGKKTQVAEHFNLPGHNGELDLEVTAIYQVPDQDSKIKDQIMRRKLESKLILDMETMLPHGLNKKVDEFGKLVVPIMFGRDLGKVTKQIMETYSKLQELYPKYFVDELRIAYKRNRNLRDVLVSSKLKEIDH